MKHVGLFIRFWEDMLELDPSALDNLLKIFEAKDTYDADDNENGPGLQSLACVLLHAFRKDIKSHIHYSQEKKDVRAFLTIWRIVKSECERG